MECRGQWGQTPSQARHLTGNSILDWRSLGHIDLQVFHWDSNTASTGLLEKATTQSSLESQHYPLCKTPMNLTVLEPGADINNAGHDGIKRLGLQDSK